MPLDTRIPLSFRAPQFESPLNAYAQMSQIKGQQQAQQLNALQMQQLQKSAAREEEVRNALRGAVTPEDIMKAGAGVGDIGTVSAAIKMQRDQASQRASEATTKLNEFKVARDVLATIDPNDQAAYDLYRQKYDTEGALPPTWNADVKKNLIMTADTWVKQTQMSLYQQEQLGVSKGNLAVAQGNAAETASYHQGMLAAADRRATAAENRTDGALTRKGYRMLPDGSMERIPGGPADPKVIREQQHVTLSERDIQGREKVYPKATMAVKAFESEADANIKDLQALKNHPGLGDITGYVEGRIPGFTLSEKGRQAYALYKKILARGGFAKLTEMRQASPTGGALGNVSDREGQYLREAYGALDLVQDPKSLGAAIDDIIATTEATKGRIREAYDLDYEYRNAGGEKPKTTDTGFDYPADVTTEAERNEYDVLMGRRK